MVRNQELSPAWVCATGKDPRGLEKDVGKGGTSGEALRRFRCQSGCFTGALGPPGERRGLHGSADFPGSGVFSDDGLRGAGEEPLWDRLPSVCLDATFLCERTRGHTGYFLGYPPLGAWTNPRAHSRRTVPPSRRGRPSRPYHACAERGVRGFVSPRVGSRLRCVSPYPGCSPGLYFEAAVPSVQSGLGRA